MKLTLFLSMLTVFQLWASETYSQMTKLTLNLENIRIADALREIEDQSEFYFLYSPKLIDVEKRVNISAEKEPIKNILTGIFGKDVKFIVYDRQVILTPETKSELPSELQQQKITGKVTDNSGAPLPGVSVLVKGTTIGATTDIDGNFSLTVPPEGKILAFSFIGMDSQEVTISNQTIFNIALEESAIGLDEVVVIGYGVQRKVTLTGSISQVQGDEVIKSPSPNIATSLQGKLPGLIINQRSGNPGNENLDILVRGKSTFNDSNPLIVIDGVPRDGTLEQINPKDVESITVLKDATAAIYGARAANGVILVTTKAGIQGAPKFEVSYNSAITQPTLIPDYIESPEYAEIQNEGAYYLQGRPAMSDFKPIWTDAELQKFRDGSDPVQYPNTDWVKETTKKWATQQVANIQARGGGENTRYMISFEALDQRSNYKNRVDEKYKRYNTRANLSVDLTKGLTIGANISGKIFDRNSGTTGTGIDNLVFGTTTADEKPLNIGGSGGGNPTQVCVYPNGLLARGAPKGNEGGFSNFKNSTIQTTFTATYKVPFVKGLRLDASYNYDFKNVFQKNFVKPTMYHEYNVLTGEYDQKYTNETIQLMDTYSRWTNILSNFRILYETTIAANHNINVMVGAEQQHETFSYANAYRKNFVSGAIPEINVGSTASADLNNGGSSSENSYNNFFGRFNYNFKSKYLLEFLFRYDGSSIFPEENRYGFFPAVSAGWRISEENFLAGASFLDELKIRGSYGEVGNDRVPDYQYLQAFKFGNNFVFGGKDFPGIYSSTMPNPDITWEVSRKTDFGVEAVLWESLLGLDITVYKENRSNILLSRIFSLPKTAGFPALPDQNFGKVESSGFEVTLTHRNNRRELIYSINGNISYSRSKIIFMDEVPPIEAYQANTGMPLGSSLYYKSDGLFNTQAELDAYPHSVRTEVGDIKILDLNNDGLINGNDRYRSNNSPSPQLVFGLSTNLEYKGFDLSLFFQGQALAYREGAPGENMVYRATRRWTINNQEGATMPRSSGYTIGTSDFFLYDATFVRLKNAEIGYNLSNDLSQKIRLNNVRIYISGTNLLTWAKEIKWADPESGGGYPPLRIINFGINVNF
jgi:TonB-linked SusC/RagA family outer membrane protein